MADQGEAGTANSDAGHAEQQIASDESRIGVVCTDAGGLIVEANGQFLLMLGYERNQLRGRAFDDIVHPDDRWLDLRAISAPRPEGSAPSTHEKRFLGATGKSLLTAVRASAIGVGENRAGVVVLVADLKAERDAIQAVDERKALLDQVLSSAPMVVFAYDETGMITLCETRHTHPGLATRELVGSAIWDLVGDQPDVMEHFRRSLAGESGMVNLELDGVSFNCQYRPIKGPAGEVLGVSGVALDVSDLQAAAIENVHLSDFLARMSHELRTPLNAILGFAQLLASETGGHLNTRQKRYIGNIDSGGRQLLSLVNDILDLSKVKSGHMTLAEDVLDVRTVLHAAALQSGVLGEPRGIEIVERPCPVIKFTADSRRVHQILLNLLSNAIKFSPTGGLVELEGRLEDGQVRLSVSDSGPGIAADQLLIVFDEYRQADDQRGGGEGTGLGLSLSRRLAELMGGSLSATSEVGAGSRFSLLLPAAQPDS